MKTKLSYLSLCFVLLFSILAMQTIYAADEPVCKRDPRADMMNFVPGEVIIKMKDAVVIPQGSRVKSAGANSVDKVLQNYGVNELEKLFPTAKKPTVRKMMRSPQGKTMTAPRLDNIYRVSIPKTDKKNTNPMMETLQLVEELKALPDVEYAEPNYIYTIDDLKPVGDIITADELKNMQTPQQANNGGVIPNDPLFSQQSYIQDVKADLVWTQTTGDSTQVIAILDTGVDWTHPDLKNKIWRNPGEIEGNDRDDDGNGFIDDYMGWDFINNDNNPMDDNSHGTHVAGIAAAEANNGIGIAGVNWNAKIMPIKVFQSSGRGDAATITRGIIYATQKGATVINMSFGSYARSQAMEDALANAYATTILVAAAGNDGMDIGDCPPSAPFFPAAFSFVLGVQAPEAGFSNYDCTGPTFSNSSALYNYEMKAPGTNIISTIPKGNYRKYQGTSMAAPIVSGAVSLYRKLIPADEETHEVMWTKLIQATETYLDINKALTIIPKPEVWFLNKVMVDTLGNADRDGRVDAGERIQLWFRARNTGGQVDSVYWKIRLAEFEDPTTCTIIKPTSYLGSISPYATRTSETDPMILDISPNVAHGRDITFDLLSWYKGANDTIIQKFILTPENGEELKGVLDGEKILYPNRLYLVNQSFKVGETGTLIIKPGTRMLFYPRKTIPVKGKLIAEGKPDSLIYMSGSDWSTRSLFSFSNYPNKNRFNYCYFDKCGDEGIHNSPPSIINSILNVSLLANVDSLINNNCNIFGGIGSYKYVYKNNFIGPSTTQDYFLTSAFGPISYDNMANFQYNNIFNYCIPTQEWSDSTMQNAWISEYSKPAHDWDGTFYKDVTFKYIKYYTPDNSSADFQKVQYQYWGTADSTKIEDFIYDFMEDATYPRAKFQPYLIAPPEECHGIVWKILVNGKDAQDEKVEPVGVGKQRFDIYFNRPMDKAITPQVSFGVRYPFTQQSVNEDGAWSEDGRIYTVYKTIGLTSGDGINRIRVFGAKDLDGWEIPLEDMRFNFLISAAGSASAEFMASPGLGKVELEWNNNDLEDGIGYNMYRMEHINDSTLTEPILINNTLITDTVYTDFSVVPNQRYYYYYKILRTNMAETDSSKVVSAVPFTADKGDANGDLKVNVLDVTSVVAYLLNQNPQPFIYEAADYNSDTYVNVLDIVGIVNKILGKPQGVIKRVKGDFTPKVELYIQNDTLFADANVAVGGIQLDIKGVNSVEEIEVLKALQGFEAANNLKGDTLRMVFYSMSGKTVAAGNRIPLLKLVPDAIVSEAVFGTSNGTPINVNYVLARMEDISANMNQDKVELGQNYPNPAVNGQTVIPIQIFEPVDEVSLVITNILGQQVDEIKLSNTAIGKHQITWNTFGKQGLFAYTLKIKTKGGIVRCPARVMIVK